MSWPDRAVERAAGSLESVAEGAAGKGGLGERIAPSVEEDARFLRKLAPSRVGRRLREGASPRERASRPPVRGRGGLTTLAAAFALGVVVAKLVEWRSYAE